MCEQNIETVPRKSKLCSEINDFSCLLQLNTV